MQTLESQLVGTMEEWPADVRRVFETIEHSFPPIIQRRKLARTPYKREGRLTLDGQPEEFSIYTRDVNRWTVGFITSHRLETNQRALLHLPGPDGIPHQMHCRVIRTREILDGWFDICVEFPTENAFSEDEIANH